MSAPRFSSVPPYAATSGPEAADLARIVGIDLDPWQRMVLDAALGERTDGRWSAFEVGVNVPRQNGKNLVAAIRELFGLFVLGERLILHSAHNFATSLEAFRLLLSLIEASPELERRVKRVTRSHGEEGVELQTGARVRFRTCSAGGGRGFSVDAAIFDECMYLPDVAIAALLPTLSASAARGGPQVWFLGSAADQLVHEHSIVWSRIRERGVRGDDPSLCYFEWSAAGADRPDDVTAEMAADPEAWAQANPALGRRITREHIEHERAAMGAREFATERLGVGDWADSTLADGRVISSAAWQACEDPSSSPLDPVCFAVDVTPDRSSASIAAAGERSDGAMHIEVVDARRGTGWVVDRIAELVEVHRPSGVIIDSGGPAGSLLAELERRRVDVTTINARQLTQAAGGLFDRVENRTVRHLGTVELRLAVAGAKKRKLVDSWAFSRRNSSVDISGLVAASLAIWGAEGRHRPRYVWSASEVFASSFDWSRPVSEIERLRREATRDEAEDAERLRQAELTIAAIEGNRP